MNPLDQEKSISRVLKAIEAIKNGEMIIMVDEEDRENEGDIVFAAEHVNSENVNFMSREARGLICLALEPAIIERLRLPMMRDEGKSSAARETAFTVSIEAKHGVTTGISAHDRAQTIRVAVDEKSTPDDIVVPGHIFPLRARSGGVLERAGHTEGSVDLALLAGCRGAAVICEIMNEDGSMARMPDLVKLAAKFNLPIVSIPDLINYRLLQDSLLELKEKTKLRTEFGVFDTWVFRSKVDDSLHLALLKGDHFSEKVVDVRVHLQRSMVDVFGVSDGGQRRIAQGLKILSESDCAVFLYLGRSASARALLQDLEDLKPAELRGVEARPSAAMDQRQIGVGAQILRSLGIKRMRIHARSNKAYIGLSGFGLETVEHCIMD